MHPNESVQISDRIYRIRIIQLTGVSMVPYPNNPFILPLKKDDDPAKIG